MLNYQLIDSEEQVQSLCALVAKQKSDDFIAIDTEFDRVKTYFPELALIQLEIKGQCYLADPIRVELGPLIKTLCKSPAQILLFSCDEDLEVLAHHARLATGEIILPEHLWDLQLLPLFAGINDKMGLQRAAAKYLGVELLKSETRSDWLMRPLSESQLEYAALDVAYLEALRKQELKEFSADDVRIQWFFKAMQQKREQYLKEPFADELYLSVGGAGELSEKALRRLQFICKKRYELGRERNEALNRVITGKALLSIARFTPLTLQGLRDSGMKPGAVRQFGYIVLKWIRESLELGDEPIKPAYDAYAPGRSSKKSGNVLKAFLEERAKNCRIASDLICSKKLINDYFYQKKQGQKPLLEQGWMHECVGECSLAFKE